MESSLNFDEGSELGYQASLSSLDRTESSTTAETPISISAESLIFCRSYSETSAFCEQTADDSNSYLNESSPCHWRPMTRPTLQCLNIDVTSEMKQRKNVEDDKELDGSELELMKERFSKLLLGEDMSGSGKGVCTAVAISNAITNLYATVFGQNLRLEPMKPEKKAMWKREMNCLLSVCDYIVEFIPKSHSLQDGTTLEVMESQLRSDIYINLPALRKLDAMLIEILDSFQDREFWYAEQGGFSTGSGSFRQVIVQQKEEKWWVPVPCVPSGGLSENARKHLRYKRDCANQIHKAAMAINAAILSEMEIPGTYMASLPKSGKSSVGETIYWYMCTADKFSPYHLLDCLNIASEHKALELADRVEASMYTWRRKACLSHSKSSWNMVKDLMSDMDRSDKNHVLAERADTLLFCLKQRFPGLAQTSLDSCKIQYNQDVGQAILESYSRVLEGLAFNIVAWIENVLFVDKSERNQDTLDRT